MIPLLLCHHIVVGVHGESEISHNVNDISWQVKERSLDAHQKKVPRVQVPLLEVHDKMAEVDLGLTVQQLLLKNV